MMNEWSEKKKSEYLSGNYANWLELLSKKESARLEEEAINLKEKNSNTNSVIEIVFKDKPRKFKLSDPFSLSFLAFTLALRSLDNPQVNSILDQFKVVVKDINGEEVK